MQTAPKMDSPLSQDVWEGVLYMKRWGKLGLNPQTGAWAVKGKWQGRRQYFSEIPTVGGGWLVCRSKEMAEHLQHRLQRQEEERQGHVAAIGLHVGQQAPHQPAVVGFAEDLFFHLP